MNPGPFMRRLQEHLRKIPTGYELIIMQNSAALYPAGTYHRHLTQTSGGFGLDEYATEDIPLPPSVIPYPEGN